MRGDAVGQFEEGLEPLLLGDAEYLHVGEPLAAGERGAEPDDHDVDQTVLPGPFDTRIRQSPEAVYQTGGATYLQGRRIG